MEEAKSSTNKRDAVTYPDGAEATKKKPASITLPPNRTPSSTASMAPVAVASGGLPGRAKTLTEEYDPIAEFSFQPWRLEAATLGMADAARLSQNARAAAPPLSKNDGAKGPENPDAATGGSAKSQPSTVAKPVLLLFKKYDDVKAAATATTITTVQVAAPSKRPLDADGEDTNTPNKRAQSEKAGTAGSPSGNKTGVASPDEESDSAASASADTSDSNIKTPRERPELEWVGDPRLDCGTLRLALAFSCATEDLRERVPDVDLADFSLRCSRCAVQRTLEVVVDGVFTWYCKCHDEFDARAFVASSLPDELPWLSVCEGVADLLCNNRDALNACTLCPLLIEPNDVEARSAEVIEAMGELLDVLSKSTRFHERAGNGQLTLAEIEAELDHDADDTYDVQEIPSEIEAVRKAAHRVRTEAALLSAIRDGSWAQSGPITLFLQEHCRGRPAVVHEGSAEALLTTTPPGSNNAAVTSYGEEEVQDEESGSEVDSAASASERDDCDSDEAILLSDVEREIPAQHDASVQRSRKRDASERPDEAAAASSQMRSSSVMATAAATVAVAAQPGNRAIEGTCEGLDLISFLRFARSLSAADGGYDTDEQGTLLELAASVLGVDSITLQGHAAAFIRSLRPSHVLCEWINDHWKLGKDECAAEIERPNYAGDYVFLAALCDRFAGVAWRIIGGDSKSAEYHPFQRRCTTIHAFVLIRSSGNGAAGACFALPAITVAAAQPPTPNTVAAILVYGDCGEQPQELARFLETPDGERCCAKCISEAAVLRMLAHDGRGGCCLTCGVKSAASGGMCKGCKSALTSGQNRIIIVCSCGAKSSVADGRAGCPSCKCTWTLRTFVEGAQQEALRHRDHRYILSAVPEKVRVRILGPIKTERSADESVATITMQLLDDERLELVVGPGSRTRASIVRDVSPLQLLDVKRIVAGDALLPVLPVPLVSSDAAAGWAQKLFESLNPLDLVATLLDCPLQLQELPCGALLKTPAAILSRETLRSALCHEAQQLGLAVRLGLCVEQADLHLIWERVPLDGERPEEGTEGAACATPYEQKMCKVDLLERLERIAVTFGRRALLWVIFCGMHQSRAGESPPPEGLLANDGDFQRNNLRLAAEGLYLCAARLAAARGVSHLVGKFNSSRMRDFLAIVSRRTAQARQHEPAPAARLAIPEAPFELDVLGWCTEQPGILCVDLYYGTECVAKAAALSTTVLREHTKLDKWATALIGKPVASKFNASAVGDDLVLWATKLAQQGKAMEPQQEIDCYGRQVISGQSVFVVFKRAVLSIDSGALIDKGLRFSDRFGAIQRYSHLAVKAEKGSVFDYIHAWDACYKGVNLEVLTVLLAACAMNMVSPEDTPSIMLFGKKDGGKTMLLEFILRCFGFSRSALMASITEADFWDRLNDFKGMPLCCNDAKEASDFLKLLEKMIPAAYDSTASGRQRGHHRTAGGFIMGALNDKRDVRPGANGPLERLLRLKSVSERCVLVPVHSIPSGSVKEPTWRDEELSPVLLMQELLTIKAPLAGAQDPPSVTCLPDGRLRRHLACLHHYVTVISEKAKLDVEKVEAYWAELVEVAMEKQTCDDKALVAEFGRLMRLRFFEPDGATLVPLERRLSKTDANKTMIQRDVTEANFCIHLDEVIAELLELEECSDDWKREMSVEGAAERLKTALGPLRDKAVRAEHAKNFNGRKMSVWCPSR